MIRIISLCLVLLALSQSQSSADEYPSRPIVIMVGLAAGGVSDVMTRFYADVVSKKIGQRVLIENRPTGSGSVAAGALQSAAPDGYTLLVFPIAQHATIPALEKNVSYDPVKGNQPITLLFSIATLVVVPADSPVHSIKDLVVYAKQKTGGLTFGSPGLGTPAHLSGAKLMDVIKAPAQFIHYRGAAPMLTDLLPGRLDAAVLSSLTAKPYLVDKKIRAIVSDANEKWPVAPEIPLLRDVGLRDASLPSWFGLAAPPGTPPVIIKKLNEAFVTAGNDPDLRRRIEDNGLTVLTSTPEEMQAMILKDNADIAQLVHSLDLRK